MMDYYQQQAPQQAQKPNKVPKSINTNVVLYLGELPPDVDQYELHQFIMSHGKFNVESLIVKPTKENKSYAYVKLKTRSEVEKAKLILHLKSMRNYVIKAEPFRQKDSLKEENTKNRISQNSNTNLFVKNLTSATTSKELFELFSKFGEIISIKLRQNKNGECLGYGYVNFQESSSAEEAMKNLHDSQYQGKKLFVGLFSPKKERSGNDEDKFPLVLVKNCPNNIKTEKDLQEIFSKFGQISFCGLVSNLENKVTPTESSSPTPEAESKLAVVLFSNKEEAEDAVAALNETTLDDSGIPVLLSLAPINKETLEKLWKAKRESYKSKYEGCNLVVKNIPKDVTERNLFEIGKIYGDLAVARISTEGKMKVIQDDNGFILDKEFVYESKGYGFILYKNAEDASKAKEALNQTVDYKGQILSLIVEYYDYTKAEKNNNLGGNKNPKSFENRSPNKKKFFNNNNNNNNNININNNNNNNNNNYNFSKNPKFNNQNKNYMKSQQITSNPNMPPRNAMMSKGSPNQQQNNNFYNNNKMMMPPQNPQMPMYANQNNQMYSNNTSNPNMKMNLPMQQQSPNMMQGNQNVNLSQNLNMHLNPQLSQINSQMSQISPFNVQPIKSSEEVEFLNEINKILRSANSEEKTELLGETIFYYLLRFIAKYNLNTSKGRFDDPTLCSKLTGMFLSIEEKDLLDIFSNQEVLTITINDVLMVKYIF